MIADGRRILVWASAGLLCAAGGCGPHASFEYDAMDMLPPHEDLTEFSLGEYNIPIPVAEDRGGTPVRNGFQFDFELHALVSPAEVSRVAAAWDRHHGTIRDHVIRVCRNATVDELQEPELATLKARLMDGLAAQIGEKEVRRLLITEIVSQQL